jgi:hypothetical protein
MLGGPDHLGCAFRGWPHVRPSYEAGGHILGGSAIVSETASTRAGAVSWFDRCPAALPVPLPTARRSGVMCAVPWRRNLQDGGCAKSLRQKCPSNVLPSPYAPFLDIRFKFLNELMSRQITEQSNAVPCQPASMIFSLA